MVLQLGKDKGHVSHKPIMNKMHGALLTDERGCGGGDPACVEEIR
jgi:hypothetical protein